MPNTEQFIIDNNHCYLQANIVPWDSQVFGYTVANISDFKIRDENNNDASKFESFIDWCEINACRLVSCRIPSDAIAESFFLEGMGFNFIEVNLHPVIHKLDQYTDATEYLKINHASINDKDDIYNIASNAFKYERYHFDPLIDSSLADIRYGNWINNSYKSCSQELYKIMADSDEIAAFFLVEEMPQNAVYWHLTAVNPNLHGSGFGYKAWSSMISYHKSQKMKSISTTISARNIPVLNLYSKLNFRFKKPDITFHWHR